MDKIVVEVELVREYLRRCWKLMLICGKIKENQPSRSNGSRTSRATIGVIICWIESLKLFQCREDYSAKPFSLRLCCGGLGFKCGRYRLTKRRTLEIEQYYKIDDLEIWKEEYNMPPREMAPAVLEAHGRRRSFMPSVYASRSFRNVPGRTNFQLCAHQDCAASSLGTRSARADDGFDGRAMAYEREPRGADK